MATWEEFWRVVVIDTDRHMLETFKFGLRIRPNNLEIDNLGMVVITILIYVPVGRSPAVVVVAVGQTGYLLSNPVATGFVASAFSTSLFSRTCRSFS